jgi:Ser/Thr protein kinase RdoA (MazF antagonist)
LGDLIVFAGLGSLRALIGSDRATLERVLAVRDDRSVQDGVPSALLKQAGLVALERLPARQGCMWLVDWDGTLGVLRRLDPAPGWAADADLAADAGWVHGFLRRLAGNGFAAPRPLPVFGHRSWTVTGPGAWEVVSFVPGDVAGSAAGVAMEAVGALLARYHAAACQVRMASQRPIALPLARVPAVLASAGRHAAGQDEQMRLVRYLAGELAADLDRIRQAGIPHMVIHGDFTNHNVIAAGQPPRPYGVIDFALAHLEWPLADIGYGLWRSGRPHDQATRLDMPRAQRFVRGYTCVQPLSADDAAAIEVFIRGRGLQILAKRVLAGRPNLRPLKQVQWLSTHRQLIAAALAGAVS